MKRLHPLVHLLALGAMVFPVFTLSAQTHPGYLRIMQGPMVGAVGPDYALIWVRGSYELEMQVEYGEDLNLNDALRTDPVSVNKEGDYTATLRIDGLKPDTRYYYRVLVNGKPDKYIGEDSPASFKTAPAEDYSGTFRVAFGTCARYQFDRVQEIWRIVPQYEPDLFFWLGDNIYGDSLDPDIIAEEYRRQRDVPSLVDLLARLPQLAIWDDHDAGLNDGDRSNPSREKMLGVFQRYWPNPAFGTEQTPGVFFHYNYGGVDFYFLDNRFYRDPNSDPDTPEKTHLGADQLAWLKDHLRKSEAPFKMVITGGGWSTAKGPTGDSWAAYLHERDEIFNFIRDEEISGVVLISGDTHMAELNAIPWSEEGGYDLYDLVSSPLAQRPSAGGVFRQPEARVRMPYGQTTNFGVIEFDLSGDPTLTFNVISSDGQPVWSPFVVHASELVNGVSSWESKADRNARRLMRLQEQGLSD